MLEHSIYLLYPFNHLIPTKPANGILQLQGKCLSRTDKSGCTDPWTLEDPVGSINSASTTSQQEEYSIYITPHNFKLDLRVGK